MMRLPGALVVVAVLCAPGAARADDDGDNPGLITPQKKTPPASVREGHDHQLGVGLQLAVGMRAINPYSNLYCGTVGNNGSSNEAYCLARVPMTLDFELSYGVKPSLEAMLEVRIGVERDFGATPSATDGPRIHQLAPGARFFFSESGRSKFFSTAQAVLDVTDYATANGADLGVRNVNGFWFDVQRSYGVYVFFGEEVGFTRWLSASLEAGLGIQGRYP
jgi:hypothetical protein